jgi:hypothetical protein
MTPTGDAADVWLPAPSTELPSIYVPEDVLDPAVEQRRAVLGGMLAATFIGLAIWRIATG